MGTDNRIDRGAGVLLPVFCLPSPYGIGCFGREAIEFIDLLKMAGQRYWQVLPLGPTSYGDSPYQSFSAFAGNPYFIDLRQLASEGLISPELADEYSWGDDPAYVSYDVMYKNRYKVLRQAAAASRHEKTREYRDFTEQNAYWLDDYSLFMACKDYFGGASWLEWDEDIKTRKPKALARYRSMLADDVAFWSFCQFEFFRQWGAIKEYANANGISIIGDMPIYAAMDSADVWVAPQLFLMDEELVPTFIAGVPPDAFSATGQLWGNPLYDWDAMEAQDFAWWRERIRSAHRLYDVLRIDHFIGITRYYAVPYGAPDCTTGHYCQGPKSKLTDVINEECRGMKIIAEDLGVLTDEVRALRAENGYPGMKVIAFGFDGDPANEHLPHNYPDSNCICYGGTHDNETLRGLFCDKSDEVLTYLFELTGNRDREKIVPDLLRLGYGSCADVVIYQLQDILSLDNSARINHPSTVGGNWRWRLVPGQFGAGQARGLRELTRIYGRLT